MAQTKRQYTRQDIQKIVIQKARQYGVDPLLALSVAQQESHFDPYAKSGAGAIGVMQLIPSTAKGLKVNPYDPIQNIDGGVRLLRNLSKTYKGDTKKILAAYNAGPGAVAKYKGVPPYKETQKYVKSIVGMINDPNSVPHQVLTLFSPISNPIQRAMATKGLIGNIYNKLTNADKQRSQQGKQKQQGSSKQGQATGEAMPVEQLNTPQLNTGAQGYNPDMNIPQADPYSGYSGKQLAEAALEPNTDKDLPYQTYQTPLGMQKADQIAQQYAVTPEQIQQMQQPTQDALLRQEAEQKTIGQGMVDRMNALQAQYDQIINSDPRLQNQGYYIDPRDVRTEGVANSSLALLGKDPSQFTGATDLARAQYEADFANRYGVPYKDYIAAKTAQINNQMTALPQYKALQDNVNTNLGTNFNNFLDALTTYQKQGLEGLTNSQKNILEFYRPLAQQMISSQAALQGNVNTNTANMLMNNQNTNLGVLKNDADILNNYQTNMTNRLNTADRINYGGSSNVNDPVQVGKDASQMYLNLTSGGMSPDQARQAVYSATNFLLPTTTNPANYQFNGLVIDPRVVGEQ